MENKRGYVSEFRRYKKQQIRIAMDLMYRPEVIAKIRNAKTEIEIDNILTKARRKGE